MCIRDSVRACLMYTSWPKDENADAVQAYARREIVRLERGLVFLEVVTGLGPLLGLLGTILGLIRIFGSAGNTADPAQIAAGIGEAMYCTVAGLIVAIPALIAHSLFSRHIEALTIDPVSYTHLDVYKRQSIARRSPLAQPGGDKSADKRSEQTGSREHFTEYGVRMTQGHLVKKI